MTPIRNNFLPKISDSLAVNQISNGVHPVRPHLPAHDYLVALEGVMDFKPQPIGAMKAEV